MATYFDPITLEESEITEETFVYVVKLPDGRYGIKAFYGNAKQVSKDPTSNVTDYWPVDTKTLLSNQLTNAILFPAEKLTSEPLTLGQIKDFLKIDPEKMPPKPFNNALAAERLREWASEVLQQMNAQSQLQAARPDPQESILEMLENLVFHDQQFQSLPIDRVLALTMQRLADDAQLESFSESSRTAIMHNLTITRICLYVLIRISSVSFEHIQTLTAMELRCLLSHILHQRQWENEGFRRLITDLLILPEPIRALFIENFVAVNTLVNTARILPLADLLTLPVSDQILLIDKGLASVYLVNNIPMLITDILALPQEAKTLFLQNAGRVMVLVNQLNVPLKRLLSMSITDLALLIIRGDSEEAEYILNQPWFDDSHFPRLLSYIDEQLATISHPETLFNGRMPQKAFAQLKQVLKSNPMTTAITLDESTVQQLSKEPYYSQLSDCLSEGLTAKDLFDYLTSSAAYPEKKELEKKIKSIERDMELYHKNFSADERDTLLGQYLILLEKNNTPPENLHAKAVSFFKEENFTAAIKLADFAATKFVGINDKLNASTSYSVLASSYRKVNDLPAALEAAQKSYDLRLEIFNSTHPKTIEIKKKLDEIQTLLSTNVHSKP